MKHPREILIPLLVGGSVAAAIIWLTRTDFFQPVVDALATPLPSQNDLVELEGLPQPLGERFSEPTRWTDGYLGLYFKVDGVELVYRDIDPNAGAVRAAVLNRVPLRLLVDPPPKSPKGLAGEVYEVRAEGRVLVSYDMMIAHLRHAERRFREWQAERVIGYALIAAVIAAGLVALGLWALLRRIRRAAEVSGQPVGAVVRSGGLQMLLGLGLALGLVAVGFLLHSLN